MVTLQLLPPPSLYGYKNKGVLSTRVTYLRMALWKFIYIKRVSIVVPIRHASSVQIPICVATNLGTTSIGNDQTVQSTDRHSHDGKTKIKLN